MEKTKAPQMTPSPQKVKKSKEVDRGKSPTALFVSLALDMSWRLAVVVLIPIIAGSVLTNHYHSSYYLLAGILIGFIMAIIVVYQSYMLANNTEADLGNRKKK